ncbi:putative DnaJ domain, tetratricopeptide-like helical domain-containing protein [Lupinus albus]|uniref:Putative DnaJ domain, tetratricopeptide-like helical domain-containing protein n=1 Tax=Lupinus albus TaxID=3870 RepID=A0A6A4R8F7_LUPAL|nr:putative DnaJ domain, tetratricopeptide-like helical domain-containing protein [Lupinus albus]
MSTATVHLRSPINTSSVDSTSYSPPPPQPLHQTPFPHFNADTLPSSSTARARSKPRLVKLRKQSAKSRTITAASGFNPFCTDQVTVNAVSDDSSCKFGDTGFVFSASVSGRDLNCEQKEASKIEKEMEIRNSGDVEFVFSAKGSEVESNPRKNEARIVSGEGEFNSKGFVFNSKGNNLVSNSNSEKGKSSEVECERPKCFDFVFSDNRCGKASNFNVEKQESLGAIRKSDSVTRKNEDAHQNGHLGNVDIDKGKSACGSSNCSSTAYSIFPSYKLTDEMKKLNINQSEGAGIDRGSTNPHVNSSAGFVFGGSEKGCGNFGVSSGTNSSRQESCTDATSENIGGKFFKECERNDVQNGTGCGITCSSAGIPCSKPSTRDECIRQFLFGKIPVSEESQLNGATEQFSSSSFGLDSIRNNYASTGHPFSEGHDKSNSCFTRTPDTSKESFMDFKPPTWDPSCFKDNLFPELSKKSELTKKGRSSKEKGSKHTRRKLKSHSLNKKPTSLDHLLKENSSLESPHCSGSHSPMDFSPYQETRADDLDVKASEELNDLHSKFSTDYKDEPFASANRAVDTNTTDQRHGDLDSGKLLSCNGSPCVGDFHSSVPELVWPSLKTKQFSISVVGASVDAGIDFSSNTEKHKADLFCFVHGPGDSKETDFAFSVSSTVHGTSSFKCKQKKKYRRGKGRNTFAISPNMNGKFESSVQFSPLTTVNMSSQSDGMNRPQTHDQFNEEGIAYSSAIHEACEKWRVRGNQAYKDGDLSEAEDFYTLGINSVPSSERSGCLIKPLLLCYSNRAATRMRLGRIREALGDCQLATAVDPTFQKAQMRIANCHLLLGEVENAQQCFKKCMESGSVVCLDRRVMVEAAEGLQKAQKVEKCINGAAELLKKMTSDAAGNALELLTTALSISSYSEKLLQMKAEALCLLQKYDEAIQVCERSQYLAEKNSVALLNSGNDSNISMCDSYSSVNLWRWSSISKCYFHLGKLESSLNVLEKLQQVVSVNDRCVIDYIEDSLSLAATIRELLDHKTAGNEKFKLGKYKEAVENYTVALSSNIKSRPFVAICFCNRAAAHQALGQITDAIADCSMAMAINAMYAKAISRRATLHEKVRDYEQAACDLRKLISVLETQSDDKTKPSDSPTGSNGVKESRKAHQRLLSVEDQAKKQIPLDFYLILGIKAADSASDIKKSYHKAALRHHPDKAGQLLPRSENGNEGHVWKEISQEVHKDADRLFKMIGEAYAVLSDPAKRADYDLEEETRKAYQSSRGGTCRRSSNFDGYGTPTGVYKSPSDKTSSGRYYGQQSQHQWKTHGHSYSSSRW